MGGSKADMKAIGCNVALAQGIPSLSATMGPVPDVNYIDP